MNLIRSIKTALTEELSADASFILQHVQEKELITRREYRILKSSKNGEETAIELLDKLMSKNDEYCHKFISLLNEPKIQDNFPNLSSILKPQQLDPQQECDHLPSTDNSSDSDKTYKMNHSPHGCCLIINNVNFSKSQTRKGSSEDEASLREVFTWLDFKVECHQDLTKDKMMSVIQECSQRADGDCFVCCILSHGETNGLLGSDNEIVAIEDILTPLKGDKCPKLAGKPKLFFLQACRGRRFQNEVMIQDDGTAEEGVDTDAYPREMISIPAEADFLVSMATVNKHYSFRNVTTGSWFIQSLCKQLREGVHREDDILTILTHVNDDVCREEGNVRGKKAKQVPDQSFRLRKRLVFPVPNIS